MKGVREVKDKNSALVEGLVSMSRRYGGDESYVLAGGGNTSCKADGVLWVKGSGSSLGSILPEQFVRMDLAALTGMIQREYPSEDDARESAALADMMAARLPGEESKRPSVEAILHALFPQRYVLHVHPALANGLTCGKSGEERCAALFGERAVWIPLTKPGYILAKVCGELFEGRRRQTGRDVDLVFLQNHGVFAAADTVEEIDAIMEDVMATLQGALRREPDFSETEFDLAAACEIAPALRMLHSPTGNAVAVFCANTEVRRLVESEAALEALMEPFTPDHIVYCKAKPLFTSPGSDFAADLAAFEDANGYRPKIVALRGLGVFALGATKKEAETAKALFLDAVKIAVYAESFGGPLHLPGEFTRFILGWEVESYRQKASLGAASVKRLQGKIAIVTGSAQGFGKGIAEALAEQGSYVVVADLNYDGARDCAEELCELFGAGTAIAVKADVASEASVDAMVEAAVLAYGGLDILVANAGVAIAGDLETMTKEKFELVTAVNYTGYFLCAKAAARVMKLQRAHAPDYWTDIIEINSKSGLAGSNKNFAYAGSKFGGVGLTQSFALELVEYGVKVNAVCPGNLLDGPLWSDPEKGLFRQYLDAGKVPGATSIADVRRFYESKVPMNRGCTTADVARAICYVVEQQYETGQAIPVTGGQIMLK